MWTLLVNIDLFWKCRQDRYVVCSCQLFRNKFHRIFSCFDLVVISKALYVTKPCDRKGQLQRLYGVFTRPTTHCTAVSLGANSTENCRHNSRNKQTNNYHVGAPLFAWFWWFLEMLFLSFLHNCVSQKCSRLETVATHKALPAARLHHPFIVSPQNLTHEGPRVVKLFDGELSLRLLDAKKLKMEGKPSRSWRGGSLIKVTFGLENFLNTSPCLGL